MNLIILISESAIASQEVDPPATYNENSKSKPSVEEGSQTGVMAHANNFVVLCRYLPATSLAGSSPETEVPSIDGQGVGISATSDYTYSFHAFLFFLSQSRKF